MTNINTIDLFQQNGHGWRDILKVIAERQVELLVGAAILKVWMSHMHVITSTQLQEDSSCERARSRKDKNDKYIHINFCCCE